MAQNLTSGWSAIFYPLTTDGFDPNGSGREYKADPYEEGIPGYFVFKPSRSMTLATSSFYQYQTATIGGITYDPETDDWTAIFFLGSCEERTVSYLVGNTLTYSTNAGTGELTIDADAATSSGQSFSGTGEDSIPINIMEVDGMEVV